MKKVLVLPENYEVVTRTVNVPNNQTLNITEPVMLSNDKIILTDNSEIIERTVNVKVN